jgi:hypothetical protein
MYTPEVGVSRMRRGRATPRPSRGLRYSHIRVATPLPWVVTPLSCDSLTKHQTRCVSDEAREGHTEADIVAEMAEGGQPLCPPCTLHPAPCTLNPAPKT